MGFAEIALLLSVAAIFGLVAKTFKQPILIGYLFAGFLLAYFGYLKDEELLASLGKIGVALLLFLVGLEMNIREIPTIGKAALFTGLGQILFTFTIGTSIAMFLGFPLIVAAYIGIAVSFSSTIIIIKLLSEKNDLDSLYGKVAIGFLLVQDLVAILILMFLAGLGAGGLGISGYFLVAVKALILFSSVWVLSRKILPYLFEKYVAANQELLFIFSIAWALGVATLVAGPLGFTLEIGGFLAGLALSNLPEHLEIASKTRPLRDFFLTIFFLTLGANLLVDGIGEVIVPALIFSGLVLVGNPIVVMLVMGFLRFKRRTAFMSSVTVAQISEFSLIVMAMGFTLGHVTQSHVALTIIVAAITMTVSTYLILGSDKVYRKIKNYLKIFERKNPTESFFVTEEKISDHIILIGGGRAGKVLMPFLKRNKIPYLIVDYDPKVHTRLSADKYPVLFGDVSDPEIQDAARIERSILVISTISNLNDNLGLLEHIARLRHRPKTIILADNRREAIKLYEAGATYTLVPEVVAGDFLRHMLSAHGLDIDRLERMGKSHFKRIITTR